MRKIFLIFLCNISFIYADSSTLKVVYDLTTSDVTHFEKNVLQGIVANKNYFQNSFQELQVSVIIHGGAYKYFVKNLSLTEYKNETKILKEQKKLQKRIQSLAQIYDVEFLICDVGLKNHKIQKENIISVVKTVPNATIGLISKQNDGYAYIPVFD